MEQTSENTQNHFAKIKNKLSDRPAADGSSDKALLVIRIGLGLFFAWHGLGKFFGFAPDGGMEAVTGMLSGIGFFWPVVWAYVLAFVELFGGIALMLGFFTRVSSILMAIISVVAFVTVKDFAFGGAGDLDVLSFAMALALVIAGPGKISLAEKWYQEENAEPTNDTTNENNHETTSG